MTPILEVTIGQHSVAGRKPVNQDFHGAVVPEGPALTLKGVAMALADGISSSDVSQIAAETAVKSFLSDYFCTSDAWAVKTAGTRVIEATNSWLYAQNSGIEDRNRGHVATFSALIAKGRKAHMLHVGDSRIWRVVGDTLEQLSTDHRVSLSASESYLGRAMGLAPSIEIDYRAEALEPGATYLITTDGVHDFLTPREIATHIATADPQDAARNIVEAALENDSDDNLTCQIMRIDALPPRDAAGTISETENLPPAVIPRLPFELDGYHLVRKIYGSSRSHIYLAIDSETHEKVAFKVPSADLKDEPEYRRRFAMEEWIARRISSGHVLKPSPSHENRTALYVVMEFIEGQTLRQWMVDNPQPDLETVRGILGQIASGLNAFHRKDMLHQDLRPENIMIDPDGTVKIIDFGAVCVSGVLEATPVLDRHEILGTHQYAAPEYFIGYRGTEQSDLFSLGVIAYEMLTGRLPYGANVARSTSEKAQGALRYIQADTLSPKIPDWVDGALHKAVQPFPSKRYEVSSEFLADLRKPNPAFMANAFTPLAERDPVRFWKTISAILAVLVIILGLQLL